MLKKVTDEIINAAIEGFNVQKTRLDQQIAELRGMLSGNFAEATTTPKPAHEKRRRFSPAALGRMREAQRQRWARVRRETAVAKGPARPKRRISEQGLKNIIAATKKRWALKRLQAASARKATGSRKKAAIKKTAKRVAA